MSPERNLLAAILQRAVMDAFNESMDIKSHIKSDARVWLFLSKRTDSFSFLWIMEQLELDPVSFRRFLFSHSGPFSFRLEESRGDCY